MTSILDELLGDSEDNDIVAISIAHLQKEGVDTALTRKMLLRSDWARYLYCLDVCDREDVWRGIDTDYGRFMYCRYVVDRKHLWSNIRESNFAKMYCQRVKMRKEVAKYVKIPKGERGYLCWRDFMALRGQGG